MPKTIRIFYPAILWGMVILLAIGVPGENIPEGGLMELPHIDKVVHFILFAVLGILLVYGFAKKLRGKTPTKKQLLCCIILGIAFGAFTEYLQFCCLTDRNGNLADVVANGFGTIFGVILSGQFLRHKILWDFVFQEKKDPD